MPPQVHHAGMHNFTPFGFPVLPDVYHMRSVEAKNRLAALRKGSAYKSSRWQNHCK